MKQRAFYGLMATLLTVSTPAWAKLRSDCAALLKGFNPIERTLQPEYAAEISVGGRLIEPGQNLEALPSGAYLYLITDLGEALIAPKYDIEGFRLNGKGLHTHKSLLNLYERIKKSTPRVMAAGQFYMAFGELVRLDNRSGNFRGEASRLSVVQTILAQLIPLSQDLKIVATNSHDPSQSGHTPQDRAIDDFQLQVHHEVNLDPHLKKFTGLYEEMFHILKTVADRPTPDGVARFAIDIAIQSRTYEPVPIFIAPFQAATSADGFIWAFWNVDHKIKNKLMSPLMDFSFVVPEMLASIVQSEKLSEKLSEKQKTDLMRISRAFRKLRPTNPDLKPLRDFPQ